MSDSDGDTLIRNAAFAHIRRLNENHDHLTAEMLSAGFEFQGGGCR
jgi:hypothetical protein